MLAASVIGLPVAQLKQGEAEIFLPINHIDCSQPGKQLDGA